MNKEQREKLKDKIIEILDAANIEAEGCIVMDTVEIAEKILQEVERHEWKKSDGIMEYAGALSKESADKLSKFVKGEKVQ